MYPTKLNEYLVMGVPVVATDLPEIRRFDADHGDVVAVAGDADAFSAAIQRALDASPAEEVERLIAAARENSWQGKILAMHRVIDEAITTSASSRP